MKAEDTVDDRYPIYSWVLPVIPETDWAVDDDLSFYFVTEHDPDDDEAIMIPSSVVNDCLIGEFEHFSKYAVGVKPGSN